MARYIYILLRNLPREGRLSLGPADAIGAHRATTQDHGFRPAYPEIGTAIDRMGADSRRLEPRGALWRRRSVV